MLVAVPRAKLSLRVLEQIEARIVVAVRERRNPNLREHFPERVGVVP